MEFILKYCLINILSLVGMSEEHGEKIDENYEGVAKGKKSEIPH